MARPRLFDSHAIDATLTLTEVVRVDKPHSALAFSDGHRDSENDVKTT